LYQASKIKIVLILKARKVALTCSSVEIKDKNKMALIMKLKMIQIIEVIILANMKLLFVVLQL